MARWWEVCVVLVIFSCSWKTGEMSKPHNSCDDLGIDEAALTLVIPPGLSDKHEAVVLQTQSDVCWECPLEDRLRLNTMAQQAKNECMPVDTAFGTRMKVVNLNGNAVCTSLVINNTSKNWYHFIEYGTYSLYVARDPGNNSHVECNLVIMNEDMQYLPILISFLIYSVLALVWILFLMLYRKHYLYRILFCLQTEHLVESDLGDPTNINPGDKDATSGHAPKRLKSLDTFRGISITIMIFVNYGGGQYWFFEHSQWNGLTVADLVFPWFVFIMGTAMAISFRSQLKRSIPKGTMLYRIFKRAVLLFFLGLVINSVGGHTDMSNFRIPGVLQRFAVTYLIVALMELIFARVDDRHQTRWWAPVRDLTYFWPEWVIASCLMMMYLVVTFTVIIPGCPTGYVGPGGLHQNYSQENCTGGMAGYIDRWILGKDHIYQHPSCKIVYKTEMPYDPEGILGTVTSVFICFFGLQAGKIVLIYKEHKPRIIRWLVWSIITGIVALILTKGTQNDGWVPLNKNLWSLSFVLAMSSLSFILLTICYVFIDVLGWWNGAPFFYAGMNSIFLYCAHEIMHNTFPVSVKVPQTHAAQLGMDLWGTTFWVATSVYMYYRKIFITV